MASLYRIASNQYWGGSTCFGKTFFIFYLINFYWSEILYSWQILPKEISTKIHPTHLPLHIEVFVWYVHLYLSFIILIFVLFILPHFPSQVPRPTWDILTTIFHTEIYLDFFWQRTFQPLVCHIGNLLNSDKKSF